LEGSSDGGTLGALILAALNLLQHNRDRLQRFFVP
jgi:hypothetical protein